MLKSICQLPRFCFELPIVDLTVEYMNWLSSEPQFAVAVYSEAVSLWRFSIRNQLGLFNPKDNPGKNVFFTKLRYGPSEPVSKQEDESLIHYRLADYFRDRFNIMHQTYKEVVYLVTDWLLVTESGLKSARFNACSRKVVFRMVYTGIKALEALLQTKDAHCHFLRATIYRILLAWFAREPMWGDGDAESFKIVSKVLAKLKSAPVERSGSPSSKNYIEECLGKSKVTANDIHQLVCLLVEHEVARLNTWDRPMTGDADIFKDRKLNWAHLAKIAWAVDPRIALYLPDRFTQASSAIVPQLQICLSESVIDACECPHAVDYLLGSNHDTALKHLTLWAPSSPIFSIGILSEEEKIDKRVLQYAMKSLEHFPVDLVFFYIPQMVQTLRYDSSGYIERFILNTAKTSQLFAHQIIWNMNANMFKDGEGIEVLLTVFINRSNR